METSPWVPISPRETKIDHINLIVVVADTHQKVGRLDVTMNQVMSVDIFNAGDLSGCNQYSAPQ
jgi:hypothetical protein